MSAAHDLPLSPRVQEGLQLVQAGRFSKKERWGEDLSVLDGSSVNLPLVKRKALAIEKVLSEMPVSIRRHELLVGSAVPTLLLSMAALPEYATPEEVDMAAKRLTSPYSVWGHSTPSYPRFLKLGFDGLLDLAKGKLEEIREHDARPTEEAWYESVIISVEALKTLVQRYRELALELAAEETQGRRKRELHEIAGVLEHLLEGPPITFHQALQAVWISHVAFLSTQISTCGHF
jgi:hypothetical protein